VSVVVRRPAKPGCGERGAQRRRATGGQGAGLLSPALSLSLAPSLSFSVCLTCRKSQFSISIRVDAPLVRASRSVLFMEMISCNLMVRSSSLLPPPPSICTLGRMATGGTKMCLRTDEEEEEGAGAGEGRGTAEVSGGKQGIEEQQR
jgi:hypothetical protein